MFRIRSNSQKSHKIRSKPKQIQTEQTDQNTLKQTKPNLYLCLSNQSNSELLWIRILQNQMDLKSTVVAFQSNSNIKIDTKQRLKWRQTFLLKKQIIGCIINEEFTHLLKKLKELKENSINQSSIAFLMIEFCQMREKIMKNGYRYDKELISYIKKSVIPIVNNDKDRFNLLSVRILYILALHIIKLQGVLLSQDDIELINAVLQQKRKYLNMLGNQTFQGNLESLLFTTFEFYRILYRLRRNEDLVIQNYKQIISYISIYKQKIGHYDDFERQVKIEKKLEDLVPISLYLNIYQDYEKRRALSFKNTHDQLYQIQKSSFKHLKSPMDSLNKENKAQKKLVSLNSSQSSARNSQHSSNSQIQEKSNQQNFQLKLNQIMVSLLKNTITLQRNSLQFDFLVPEQGKILFGEFRAHLNEAKLECNLSIKLKSHNEYFGLFQIKHIGLEQSDLLYHFAKKVWKIIKQKFFSDKSDFMPSLFSLEPPPIQFQPLMVQASAQMSILTAIHIAIIHYLKKVRAQHKLIGKTYPFPSNKVETLNKNKQEQKQVSIQQKIFAKRLGFINFDRKIKKKAIQNNRVITLMIKNNEKLIAYLDLDKDKCWIHTLQIKRTGNTRQDSSGTQEIFKTCQKIKAKKQLSMNQNKMKSVITSRQIKLIIYLLQSGQKNDQMRDWMKKIEEVLNKKTIEYKFEKKFEMIESDNYIDSRQNQIRVLKRKERTLRAKKITEKCILKVKNKYEIVDRFQEKNFSLYRNDRQFSILLAQRDVQKKVVYTKFRIYKQYYEKDLNSQTICKYYHKSRTLNIFQSNRLLLCASSQNIQLVHIKSKIIKISNTHRFAFINFFKTPKKMCIIQIYIFSSGEHLFCEQSMKSMKTIQFRLEITSQRVSQDGSSDSLKNGDKEFVRSSWILNKKQSLFRLVVDSQNYLICDAQKFYEFHMKHKLISQQS